MGCVSLYYHCCFVCLSNTCLLSVKSLFFCSVLPSGIAAWSTLVSFSLNIWNTFLLPVPQHATLLSGLNIIIFLYQFTGLYLILLAFLSYITEWCKTCWAAFEMADAGDCSNVPGCVHCVQLEPACLLLLIHCFSTGGKPSSEETCSALQWKCTCLLYKMGRW